MSSDDTTLAYIVDTQIAIFDDAKSDLQITLPVIAERSKLGLPTVNAWAQGRNGLSLWGVKKLLRYKALAPYLSRLFAPEGFTLIALPEGVDHDEFAKWCQDYLLTKQDAHHPESPAGRDISACEDAALRTKAVKLRAVS